MSEVEKEFQIAMLETQISCAGHDTLSSLITAVGYSVSISLYGISFSNIADSIRLELLTISSIMLLFAIASSVEYSYFHKRSVPRKMQSLRDRFLKTQATTTEHPPLTTVDNATKKTKGQKPFTTSNNAKK
jgi:hypothetical protein